MNVGSNELLTFTVKLLRLKTPGITKTIKFIRMLIFLFTSVNAFLAARYLLLTIYILIYNIDCFICTYLSI